jgi:hypothetical protein
MRRHWHLVRKQGPSLPAILSCFMRFLMYSQDCSPASGGQQSGPRQMKRWRRSLPMPKAAAMSSGERLSGLAMAAMIAGMSGEGTGGRRNGTWHITRRATVAVGSALLVVLIGSRVNRPGRVRLLEEPPHVADRVLTEVRLDTQSLQKVVDSINRAAPGAVKLDAAGLSNDQMETHNWPEQPPLRNVRIGKALMIGTQPWRGSDGIEWREVGGTIVVGAARSAATPAEGRLYDVRDILNEAEAWSKPLRPLHPRPAQQRGLFSGGYSFDAEPLRADAIAEVIKETIGPRFWDTPTWTWKAEGWGGRVWVYASARGHRDVERLLALMRRGESEPVRHKGAGR